MHTSVGSAAYLVVEGARACGRRSGHVAHSADRLQRRAPQRLTATQEQRHGK